MMPATGQSGQSRRADEFIFATVAKRSHYSRAEGSSLWLDFGDFCGNLPKSSPAFPGGITIAYSAGSLASFERTEASNCLFLIYG
jgi:hypothetical protein